MDDNFVSQRLKDTQEALIEKLFILRQISEEYPEITLLKNSLQRLEGLVQPHFEIGDQVAIQIIGTGKILPEGTNTVTGTVFSTGKRNNSFIVRLEQEVEGERLLEVEQQNIKKLQNA